MLQLRFLQSTLDPLLLMSPMNAKLSLILVPPALWLLINYCLMLVSLSPLSLFLAPSDFGQLTARLFSWMVTSGLRCLWISFLCSGRSHGGHQEGLQ